MKQLTQGNISRQLVTLSVPLLAGNILQQLYNAVDAVIVGKFVGDTAFGAVGVAGVGDEPVFVPHQRWLRRRGYDAVAVLWSWRR